MTWRLAATIYCCSVLVCSATADLTFISNQRVDNAYTDVHSVYVDGFYVMVYVGTLDGGDSNFYNYSIGLYELVNGTQLIQHKPAGSGFKIMSKNSELRLTAKPNVGSFLAILVICSSSECAKFYVGKQSITFSTTITWCHSGIKDGDILQSVNDDLGYSVAIVSRQTNLLYGLICLRNSDERTLKFTCTDDAGLAFTQIHSVDTTVKADGLSVFIIVSNSEVTALCVFTKKMTALSSSGIDTLQPSSKLTFDKYAPRALAVSAAGNDHIAFLSSNSGRISKVYIQADAAHKINEFMIEPAVTDVFSEMLLKDDRLLLTTTERLMLLDVKQTCFQHKDLCACRAPKDPKCGWCVNSYSCTKDSECSRGIWIPADPSSSKICWNATVNPKSVSRSSPEPISITINEDMGDDKFGGQGGAYRCIYGSLNITTSATTASDQSLTCAQPEARDLSRFPEGTLELPLVIYYTIRSSYLPLLVRYILVVCSGITSCGKCVTSHDSCTWCTNDHKCTTTTSAAADCPNSSSGLPTTTDECPAITVTRLRAPVNEDYALALPVKNLPTLPKQDLFCYVTDGAGQNTTLRANKVRDTVTCTAHEYGSGLNSPSFLVNSFSVSLLMGNNKWEIARAAGRVYDCAYQSVCTQCVQDVTTTNCVWCPATTQCRYNQCPAGARPINAQCPSLYILSDMVKPTVVPIEGELKLSILGHGLIVGDGYKTATVDIAGQPCRNVTAGPTEQIKGKAVDKLVCFIPAVTARQRATLKVVIDGISWQNASFIHYYDPVLEGLSVFGKNKDRHGPLAGGTVILISGQDLAPLTVVTKWYVEFINTRTPSQTPVKLIGCSIDGNGESAGIKCKTPPMESTSQYTARLMFTKNEYKRELVPSSGLFAYRENSVVHTVTPKTVIQWGGKKFQVRGKYLDSVSNPMLEFLESDSREACLVVNSRLMTCTYPQFKTIGDKQVVLIMDGISETLNVTVSANPAFKRFKEKIKDLPKELILDGDNIDNVGSEDIAVFVGEKTCKITKKESTTIICIPPDLTKEQQEESTDVTIQIYGVTRFRLGSLNYQVTAGESGLSGSVIGGIAGGGSATVIVMVVVAILLFRRSRYHKQRYKSMVKHVDQLEVNSRHEIKQAFAELQTDMTDLMHDLTATGIPYWDYKNFTFKILFPGQTDHPTLHKLLTKRKTAVMQALDMFEHLLYNKHFLISFIHTLEDQPTFTMPDKVHLASLLMLTLQHKMDYATVVIKELLSELIDSSMKKKHPKLLLRRSESVVEKMLTHWLSLCLYTYLQVHAGTPLFMLYKAIKHQIEKGPVDALSGEARYSLSQERLLRLTVDTIPITLEIILENGERIQCKVNDCDTTSQVKEKILDVIYKNQAYSLRPAASDFNLEWHHGIVGVPICDEDLTSQTVNGWKRVNTLAHYGIPDNATMKLVSRHQTHSLHSDRSRDTDKLCDTLSSNRGTPRGTLTRNGALSTSNLQDHYVHSHISLWHLSKSAGSQTLPKDRQQTMMSEIFLTRLLKTKLTLQDFIDKLFQTIFSADNLPPTIKFLFDFLDQEATRHGITDPEVVHIWKNNSLNLRFWVNIIKNPEFVFDIHKSEIVDASLSTIAQTFIDSCAMTESDFGADAPINKLLFAKDRPRYRKMLQNMYSEIRNKPPVTDQTLSAHLSELSKNYPREFYRNSALKEIYQFAQRYQTQIIQDLQDNFPKHRNPNLTTLLQDINATLDERHTHMTDYV